MNSMKINLLEEIMSHLKELQVGDLKQKLDEIKQPSDIAIKEIPFSM